MTLTILPPSPRADTTPGDLTPVERVLADLVEALDSADVPVAALRGHRTHPRYRDGSDLVLALFPRHVDRFERMLDRLCAKHGAGVVARWRVGFLARFQVHARDDAGRHHFQRVDVHTAESCCGVAFLDARELLRGRTRRRGLGRPPAVVGAVADFLGPFLASGAVRPEFATRLATVLEQHPARTRGLLGRLFGTALADHLTGALRDGHALQLFRAAKRARRSVLRRAFARRPLRSLAQLVSYAWATRVRTLWRPWTRTVSVVGADGTGRHELVHALRRELARAYRAPDGSVVEVRPELPLPDEDDLAASLAAVPPDLTIVCTATVRTVRERAPDTDVRETLRQLAAFEELARSRDDCVLVRTDDPLDGALDEALCAVLGVARPGAPEDLREAA